LAKHFLICDHAAQLQIMPKGIPDIALHLHHRRLSWTRFQISLTFFRAGLKVHLLVEI
jgi:hypothetical protein